MQFEERYGVTEDDIVDLTALFVLRGDLVNPNRPVTVCHDPDDNMVIEAALAGEAQGVVTEMITR